MAAVVAKYRKKFEARNPKHETSTNFQNTNNPNGDLEIGEFEF
jgi:hypothetical protein